MGVREGSLSAIAMIFSMYCIDVIISLRHNNSLLVVRLLILGYLLAYWRGEIAARRWEKSQAPENLALPARSPETWRDRICNRLSRVVWPYAKHAFFILTAIVLYLELTSITIIYSHPLPRFSIH